MGKESRAKAAAPEIMLPREDVPAVAVLALMDALLIDMERTTVKHACDRDIKQFRMQVTDHMKSQVIRLHSTYKGRVTDSMILHCDRYLCQVQDCMDRFFDEITEADLGEMERVKANWPQEVSPPSF